MQQKAQRWPLKCWQRAKWLKVKAQPKIKERSRHTKQSMWSLLYSYLLQQKLSRSSVSQLKVVAVCSPHSQAQHMNSSHQIHFIYTEATVSFHAFALNASTAFYYKQLSFCHSKFLFLVEVLHKRISSKSVALLFVYSLVSLELDYIICQCSTAPCTDWPELKWETDSFGLSTAHISTYCCAAE